MPFMLDFSSDESFSGTRSYKAKSKQKGTTVSTKLYFTSFYLTVVLIPELFNPSTTSTSLSSIDDNSYATSASDHSKHFSTVNNSLQDHLADFRNHVTSYNNIQGTKSVQTKKKVAIHILIKWSRKF